MHGRKKCLEIQNNMIILDAKPEQKILKFDFVAGEEVTQERMFVEVAKGIADSCLEGKPGISYSRVQWDHFCLWLDRSWKDLHDIGSWA